MTALYIREVGGTVDDVGRRLEAAVTAHQFGILGVVDLQAKMKEKGVEFAHACLIYEVCNPQRAKEVLEKDMSISTALPCRITVYEDAGKVKVATLLPTQVLGMLTAKDMGTVAEEVERTIVAIVDETVAVREI
jgi:uncharacterized protein (DUF302 family)